MPFDPSHPCPIPSLPNTSWPTINQLAALGSVAAVWNWLDLALETLIATLTKGDEMLVQALTEDLSPDNRLKAIRRLVTTWERVVNLADDQRTLLGEIAEICKEVNRHKGERNKIIHGLWMRGDDDTMFRWKHHTAPRSEESRPSPYYTKAALLEFSAEVGRLVERVNQAERAARNLPSFPLPSASGEIPAVPGLESLLAPYRVRTSP